MTEVEWHPIRIVENEEGNTEWEGRMPEPYVPVLVTSSYGEIGIDELIDDWDEYRFDTLICDVIAWAELPDPYKEPEPLDMHPDAIAARRYMENSK